MQHSVMQCTHLTRKRGADLLFLFAGGSISPVIRSVALGAHAAATTIGLMEALVARTMRGHMKA
jgi:hypothetical protein